MIGFLQRLGLFPDQASTMAARVDALFYFLVGLTAFFSVLIAGSIVWFAFKYRRRRRHEYTPRLGEPIIGSWALEITWTVIPFLLSMAIFTWGASIYFAMAQPPEDALEIFVVGKQWMWKLQHMEGRREIDELHVPVNRPVKLTMTSEDVIHSFFIPAFRVKADVLPGRYTSVWFEATKEGVYHLFCAEYCGTSHSGMIGRIVVLPGAEYQQWLAAPSRSDGGNGLGAGGEKLSMAALGERLFERNGCRTCHATSPAEATSVAQGPPLYGLWGRAVPVDSGYSVVVNEEYVRRAILDPMNEIVTGYQPIMPTYTGRLSEEDVLKLVAYIKSLAAEYHEPSQPESPEAGAAAQEGGGAF
jgi:cytochrome c oxidase subunit 2